jgi:hypothetical protein
VSLTFAPMTAMLFKFFTVVWGDREAGSQANFPVETIGILREPDKI